MFRKILLIKISFLLVIVLFTTSCGDSGKAPVNIVTNQEIVTLTWTAPTTYSDNVTPLTVAGYRLYYGFAQRTYAVVIDLGNSATTTTLKVSDMAPSETGRYYFAVTAYDASDIESDYSNELFVTL